VIQRDTIQTAKFVASINQVSGLQPLAVKKMPVDVPPPKRPGLARRSSSRVFHWVRPELVVEVKFLIWTNDGLLRQVIYHGLRVDKPAKKVRRPTPRQ
jgi:bifunctional non-homologous end joining protein LigD